MPSLSKQFRLQMLLSARRQVRLYNRASIAKVTALEEDCKDSNTQLSKCIFGYFSTCFTSPLAAPDSRIFIQLPPAKEFKSG